MRFMLLFLCLLTGCVPASKLPSQPVQKNNNVIQQLLELHNQNRESKGRSKFINDPFLNQYAQQWANHMAQQNNLYHSKLTFVNKFRFAGENIAWNQKTTAQVTNDWMNSSGHRANILNHNFTHIGFGIAYNSKGQPYWCAVFGG